MRLKKADLLFDLDSGAIGSFLRTKPITGEQGLVDVEFKPLNSFSTVTIKSIPEKAIIRFSMPELTRGAQDTYTVILENSKGEARWLSMVNDKAVVNINEIREKLNEERYRSREAKHTAKESERSLDRQAKKRLERERRVRHFSGYEYDRSPSRGQFDSHDTLDEWG